MGDNQNAITPYSEGERGHTALDAGEQDQTMTNERYYIVRDILAGKTQS